jgi:hypothetical protein
MWGNKSPRPQKILQNLQDPVHKRRLGVHDHCVTTCQLQAKNYGNIKANKSADYEFMSLKQVEFWLKVRTLNLSFSFQFC